MLCSSICNTCRIFNICIYEIYTTINCSCNNTLLRCKTILIRSRYTKVEVKTNKCSNVYINSTTNDSIGSCVVIIFSIACGFFPSAGYISVSRGIIPYIRSLFLPSLTLALLHASLYVRVFRKAVRDGIRSKYSLFALSTGMRRKELALKSAMKPSLPVLLSLISQSLVSAIGGSAVVETVFALPGIGALMVDAALSRDGQLAGIIMILLAISTAVIFFLLEGVLPLVDPRIRRGS